MSETRRTAAVAVGPEDWDQVLSQLRADGFSPTESIKVTRAVLGVGLGEAKTIVHTSQTWSDHREELDALHDSLEAASSQL